MNILPKKRWHVRTKENIARVRRDEQNAREEEEERKRKIALAEQEARTEVLRTQARKRVGSNSDDRKSYSVVGTSATEQQSEHHINLFYQLEAGDKLAGKNREYEAEKKAEQEKHERSIGLLTYLGQSASEQSGAAPWYLQGSLKKDDDKIAAAEKKKKLQMDPLNVMEKYLGSKFPRAKSITKPSVGAKKQSIEKLSEHSKAIHKKHKHKGKHRKKRHHTKPKTYASGIKTIEQLRVERLQREKAERVRTEQLLARKRSQNQHAEDPTKQVETRETSRYNSQYNPHLVRQRKFTY